MTRAERTTGSYEPRRRARRRVAQALYQWQITGDSAAELTSQFFEQQSWDRADREYFEQLLDEAIRENEKISTGLGPFLDRPLEQVDCMERSVLQLAAAELLLHPDIPYRVILDEAIDIAKRFGAEQSHSYVNAVLDKAAREWRTTEIAAEIAAGEDD